MPANRNRNLSRVRETRTVPPCTAEALIAREEPMRRYPHPIPMCRDSSPAPTEECSPCMNRVLEQLSCQNQLLVDLLGAVNSLTAAILSGKNKS